MAHTGRPPSVRVPIEPLLRLSQCENVLQLTNYMGWHDTRKRRIHRWVHDGGIPVEWMDRVATAAGFHPYEVWPAEWSEFTEGDDLDASQ